MRHKNSVILWSGETKKGKMLSEYLTTEKPTGDWRKAEWNIIYAMALLLIDMED